MVYLQRSYEGLAECLTKKGTAFYIPGHVHDNSCMHANMPKLIMVMIPS